MPVPLRQLPNPPPTGSVWELIERGRIELGWSPRRLSTEAGLNPTHYYGISHRKSWVTQTSTQSKLIAALVRHGIPPERFAERQLQVAEPASYPIPSDARAPVTGTTPELSELQDEAIELLTERGYRYRKAKRAVQSIVAFHGGKTAEAIAAMAERVITAPTALEQAPPAGGEVHQETPKRRGGARRSDSGTMPAVGVAVETAKGALDEAEERSRQRRVKQQINAVEADVKRAAARQRAREKR